MRLKPTLLPYPFHHLQADFPSQERGVGGAVPERARFQIKLIDEGRAFGEQLNR